MAYAKDNIVRQMDTYMAIRKAGWPDDDCINDVYVRNPELNSFWYVGKVARCTGEFSIVVCLFLKLIDLATMVDVAFDTSILYFQAFN